MRYLIGIISMLFSFVMYGQTRVVTISDQYGYDQINSHIETAKKDKVESLTFVFEDGLYRFNDSNVINIKSNTTTEISFIARRPGKVYIMSDGDTYYKRDGEPYSSTHYRVKLHKPLDYFCTYVDQNLKSVPISDTGYLNDSLHTNIATSPIEISSDDKMVAKVRIPAELSYMANKPQSYFKNSLICYKSQWSDCYRPILRSDSEWIYFSLNEWLAARTSTYVCNMHRWTKGIQPFFITNSIDKPSPSGISYDDNYIYIPQNINKLYVNRHNKFLNVNNSKKNISISKLSFCGSSLNEYILTSGGLPWNFSSAIMDYQYSTGGLAIVDCNFNNNGGGMIWLCSSSNVNIANNRFVNNLNQSILEMSGKNENISVSMNYIENNSSVRTSTPCININDSKNILINSNEVRNVSRSFVVVGHNNNIITISDNHIYNTDSFNQFKSRKLSSDTGVMIYSWGDSPFLAKNNIIHNLPSNYGLNGIMVDEGTGNAVIEGNLIYNVGDKCIYNWYKQSKPDSNHNNALISNIILGSISYGGFDRNDPNNSIYKGNIFLNHTCRQAMTKSLSTDYGENVYTEIFKIKGDKVQLDKKIVKKIKKDSKFSARIKKLIKRY